jgi:hypothetical protein
MDRSGQGRNGVIILMLLGNWLPWTGLKKDFSWEFQALRDCDMALDLILLKERPP